MEHDHKNIRELRYLLENYSKDSLSTMKSLHLTEENIVEFPDSKIFSLFGNLTLLSITFSTLNDFNSQIISKYCPKLTKIDLSGCILKSIKQLIPLGNLKVLESLDLSKTTISLDRYFLLSYLLHGHTITETCDRKKKISRAFSFSKSILCKNKPALVPRQGSFPMLQLLNNEIITEDEIETVRPKTEKQAKISFSDKTLKKVKQMNQKILDDKEKFGSFRTLAASNSTQNTKKPRIDTFAQIKLEKKYEMCKDQESEEEDSFIVSQDSQESSDFESWIEAEKEKVNLPGNKEEVEEMLGKSKLLRGKVEKPVERKIYNFDEVSLFMYGKRVQDTQRVNSVCEVLRILNGVKLSFGISEVEIRNRIKNPKDLSLQEMHEFQEILGLDEEIRNLRIQSGFFEWWIKKIEQKHVEFAEHKAIIALHHNRIFNNPLINPKPQEKSKRKRLIIKDPVEPSTFRNTSRKKLVLDEEPKYFVANFSSLFEPSEIKEGETIFIKPIMSFEESLDKLHSQLREKERQFENLSFGDQVLVRLENMKKNIKEREGVRDKLTKLYEQVSKLKKKFEENQTNYFFNMYEKKLDKRELLQKHDFRRFELPTFVFPL